MHELSVTRVVLQTVLDRLERDGLSQVVGITLTVGELRGFQPDWVQRYFTSAARGTAAADAVITMVTVPSRFACRGCGQEFHVDVHGDGVPRCPHCSGRDYHLCAGQELEITGMQAR
jgi:hydrogenase nickel incorporation protein HypA/HybF